MLKGKNAIVTGANGGIGSKIVETFANNGANIWACMRTQNEEYEIHLKKLADENNIWIKPIYFDLADEKLINESIQGIIKDKQPVDILVNNAGVAYSNLISMTPMEQLKNVFQVNYFAQIQIMQLVSRVMMKQKSGVILNMASISGIQVSNGYLAYGSSKSALIYATKVASKELGRYNIRVNAVAPSLTETDMIKVKSEKEVQKILDNSSLQRKADPKEIAECVLFLASDRSTYITGQALIIDGGLICI